MPYILEPEVAGGWGKGTIADTSCHPPVVSKLTYQFDGWSGDDLLTTFPCFIVSSTLAKLLAASRLSGFELASVEATKSDLFSELYPERELPNFEWLKITGSIGTADFALNQSHRLVVSNAAFAVISQTNLSQCEVTPC